jgi:hypothetical protein
MRVVKVPQRHWPLCSSSLLVRTCGMMGLPQMGTAGQGWWERPESERKAWLPSGSASFHLCSGSERH